MPSKIKLKSIYINSTNPKGEPLVDRNGESYKRAVLTTENDMKASCFIAQEKEGVYLPIIGFWKAGEEVEVNIEQSGEYYNFEPVNPIEGILRRLEALESRTEGISHKSPEKPLETTTEPPVAPAEMPPHPDTDISDVPFA